MIQSGYVLLLLLIKVVLFNISYFIIKSNTESILTKHSYCSKNKKDVKMNARLAAEVNRCSRSVSAVSLQWLKKWSLVLDLGTVQTYYK